MARASNHSRRSRIALIGVTLASLAWLATTAVSARASVVRLNGYIVGAPAWAGAAALAEVTVRSRTVVESVDPVRGESKMLEALPPEYRSRVAALGSGFALERTKTGCGRSECSRYEPGGIEARDLLYEPPGGALRCLAQLSGNGCGSPNTCAYLPAVASGTLLAYPSCSGAEQETGSVVFNELPID